MTAEVLKYTLEQVEALELAPVASGIEAKLVHVGDDGPCGNDERIALPTVVGFGQVVEALDDGGTVVAFSLLRTVETGPDVLEFRKNLRHSVGTGGLQLEPRLLCR